MKSQFWTAPNQITLLRLIFIPFVIITVFDGQWRWALGLLVAAALSDALDGLLARLLQQQTMLGQYLDPIADKLLLSSLFLVLSFVRKIPWKYTILVFSRDLCIVATAVVLYATVGFRDFRPSIYGKLSTASQIGAVFFVVLAQVLHQPWVLYLDAALDAIFIVTRHHSHADLVCRALETGKAVFVEKPLALTRDQLNRVVEVIAKTGNDRLMVGFNRRFAPLLTTMRSHFGSSAASSVTRYLVNAGPLAADSWYGNDALEGSRFIGEGGHFIDTLSWWAASLPEEIYAVPGPEKDDVQLTVRFQNGSSGTISYVAGGNSRFPKETLDATGAGRSARLDNFKMATVWSGRRHRSTRARGGQDKGQRAELAQFVQAALAGTGMPIGVESLVAVTRATIAVRESLLSGKPERV